MLHVDKAEGTTYRDELLTKIIDICSQSNYQYITNFEWSAGFLPFHLLLRPLWVLNCGVCLTGTSASWWSWPDWRARATAISSPLRCWTWPFGSKPSGPLLLPRWRLCWTTLTCWRETRSETASVRFCMRQPGSVASSLSESNSKMKMLWSGTDSEAIGFLVLRWKGGKRWSYCHISSLDQLLTLDVDRTEEGQKFSKDCKVEKPIFEIKLIFFFKLQYWFI